ncbi:Non-specific serine/threonine protein kinase [Sulfidibacter corallicola]|uniref:non-specific serine/threonine protein kinase n=1 Tax=Sulfidibacter corallicola TaxID=2818388 RepID=A0A8A4TNK7_SULCO|nr:serine/threonine-protein kinase [Sulfidibacter corallicola]QTD48175.1 protein kinase [Sulfidibacter corallicola]
MEESDYASSPYASLSSESENYQQAATSAINAPPVHEPEFKPGDSICDKYLVKRHLGSGASGDVYLVQNPVGLDEALKIMPADMSNSPRAREVLIGELSILRNLHHENVMDVYEIDVLPGTDRVFFTSEYLTDHNLFDLFHKAKSSGRELRPEIVLLWMHDVAKALTYIHGKDVVHGDIKPNNILLDQEDHVKLCDFGFAYRLLPNRKSTIHSRHQLEVGGTILFASPEQRDVLIHRLSTTVGKSSDVYSFGATLAFLLSGGYPDPGNPISVFLKSRKITAKLDAFIGTCCRKDPEERFADGQQLMEAYLKLLSFIQKQEPQFFTTDLQRSVQEMRELDGPLADLTLERDFVPGEFNDTPPPPLWNRVLLIILLIAVLTLAELNFNLTGVFESNEPPVSVYDDSPFGNRTTITQSRADILSSRSQPDPSPAPGSSDLSELMTEIDRPADEAEVDPLPPQDASEEIVDAQPQVVTTESAPSEKTPEPSASPATQQQVANPSPPPKSAATAEPSRQKPASLHFSDWMFGQFLIEHHDTNRDGVLDREEAKSIQRLQLAGNRKIRNLAGIDQLTELVYLDCSNMGLKRLPKLPSRLRYLDCSNNQLSELPFGWPRFLMYLDCSDNNLREINWLPDYLETLNVSGNQLRNLPLLPEPLITLICHGNYFETARNWAREWPCAE